MKAKIISRAFRGGFTALSATVLLLGATAASPAFAADDAAISTNSSAAIADSADTGTNADFSPDRGLVFKFRGVPLDTVLSYMSQAAGFVIHPEVSINGTVDAYSDQPLSKEEALNLVEHVLADNGYAVTRDGRILTIISAYEAKHSQIPVIKFTSLSDIPDNSEVATYIIPVRTLNPVALLNNLRPLIGQNTDLQANESANSILMTDSQSNIKRIANIIMELDSVSSSINTIEVFPLKYADAKSIADTVKELFPSSGAGGNAGGANAVRFGGANGFGGGGFGGGQGGFPGMGQNGGNGGGGSDSGATPGSRIAATSDDHSNSLIVSAPQDLIPMIRELVEKLDQPVEDVTEIHLFHFQHADPTEMASLLSSLFPDANGSTDASAMPFQFGGPGGPFGAGGQQQNSGNTSASSGHMKKLVDVTAVPDGRTQSLLVSASKSLMPQIEEMLDRLDDIDSGAQRVHRIALQNADPQDVQQIIQSLYAAGTGSSQSSSSSQQNVLANRAQTMQQNMMSSGVSSGNTTSALGSGSSSGSRGGGQ
jgi:type II secretory pathway component GspD/PulD (secretin)